MGGGGFIAVPGYVRIPCPGKYNGASGPSVGGHGEVFKKEDEDAEESNSALSKSDGDGSGLKRDICPSAVLDAERPFVGV